MPGQEHQWITEKALELLPAWQQGLIASERDNLVRHYCSYPDRYFDVLGPGHAEAAPYHFETEGIQFHYLPDTPIVPFYRYFRPDPKHKTLTLLERAENRYWRHATAGFAYYLEQSSKALRSGRTRDGCAFLGCLLHLIQDYGFGLHSLEGPYGTDCFVLGRLFPEADDYARLPENLLAEALVFDPAGVETHVPALLGRTVPEAVFHLYTRHVRVTCRARRICHAIMTAKTYSVSDLDVSALTNELSRNVVALCADVLCTALSLAAGRLEGETARLDRFFLSDMEPVDRPWGTSHYRFLTLLRDRALDARKRFVPLELAFRENGALRRITYEKGMGLGAHFDTRLAYQLPHDLYRSFTCALGLYPDSMADGVIRVSLRHNDAVVFEQVFSKAHPAARIRLADPGGRIELRLENETGMAGKAHLVWAEPLVTRGEDPEQPTGGGNGLERTD